MEADEAIFIAVSRDGLTCVPLIAVVHIDDRSGINVLEHDGEREIV